MKHRGRPSIIRTLHPAGLLAAPFVGAWFGFYHEDAFLWLGVGPMFGALSLWHDWKAILQDSPWRDPKLAPYPTPPSDYWKPEVIGGFLSIYITATAIASALIIGAYWVARLLHPISN